MTDTKIQPWARLEMLNMAKLLTNLADYKRVTPDTDELNLLKTRLENMNRALVETDLLAAPRPELTVWEGPMPESNGRSNFTATLMRKGADWMDTSGYTFTRSEYPDRVRYEADCMRFLIGELATEPWITDYDADKHSGYVSPAPSRFSERELAKACVECEVPDSVYESLCIALKGVA
jgi:hypothetical protein